MVDVTEDDRWNGARQATASAGSIHCQQLSGNAMPRAVTRMAAVYRQRSPQRRCALPEAPPSRLPLFKSPLYLLQPPLRQRRSIVRRVFRAGITRRTHHK
jgi:hypothetical protein